MHSSRDIFIKTASAAFFLLILASCTFSSPPQLQKMAPMPPGKLCRVAVLPFINETQYPQGDTIIHKIFLAEFVKSGGYLVAQEGDIWKIYKQIQVYPGQLPNFEQMKILGDILNLHLILTGKVVELTEDSGSRSINPSLTLYLQIHEAKSGKTIWSTYHRRDGEHYRKALHFGKINNVTSLTQAVVREVLDKWYVEGLEKCPD